MLSGEPNRRSGVREEQLKKIKLYSETDVTTMESLVMRKTALNRHAIIMEELIVQQQQ